MRLDKQTLRRFYERHGEKLRYLVVGVCNTAVSYLIFLALLAILGRPLHSLDDSSSQAVAFIGRHYYLFVQWAAWVILVPVSATTMKYWAFRSPGRLGRQIFRAYFVYLPAQLLSTAILWFTVKVLHLWPSVGQLVTIALATVFSYIGHKYFTFRVPLEVGEVPNRDLIEEKDS